MGLSEDLDRTLRRAGGERWPGVGLALPLRGGQSADGRAATSGGQLQLAGGGAPAGTGGGLAAAVTGSLEDGHGSCRLAGGVGTT